MHIPDGFLTPRVWGTTDIVAGAFVAVGLRRLNQRLEENAIPLMGVLAAFVFAAQMINLPIAGGTSAHFLGGALLGALLGPWAGLVVITVVLMVQCFIFQDGGVAALGANVCTMGVLGSFCTGYLYRGLSKILHGPRKLFWAGFLAAWTGVTVSSVACAAFLWLSGVVSWRLGLVVISGVHVLLGLIEGLITGTVLESLARRRPDLLTRARI